MAANLIQLPKRKTSARDHLWARTGGKCHWCGIMTTLQENRWHTATRDHILPRYKGGGGDAWNIVLACFRCNNRRSHEDARGLPEGALLGKYKTQSTGVVSPSAEGKVNRICLTKDDKKALFAKPAPIAAVVTVQDFETVRDARDSALKQLADTRFKLESHRLALEHLQAELQQWKSMSVWHLIRIRLSQILMPK